MEKRTLKKPLKIEKNTYSCYGSETPWHQTLPGQIVIGVGVGMTCNVLTQVIFGG